MDDCKSEAAVNQQRGNQYPRSDLVLDSAFDLWIIDIVQKCSGNCMHVASVKQKHAYAVVIHLVLKSKRISHRELHD